MHRGPGTTGRGQGCLVRHAPMINAALAVVVLVAAAAVGWLYFGEQTDDSRAVGGQQPVAVVAATVQLQPLQDSIQALGTARASEAITVTAEITGVVDEIS